MDEPFAKNDIKIAVIGGGTGSFTLLSSLKNYTKQLAAIVNMVDDGGSTGVLRDELGTLPSGDVRQCLVALSDSPKIRDLFDYRFEEGTLGGHSFGNILLTALEKVTGSFTEAVATASDILRVNGMVIPATLDDVRLKMEWPEASLILQGERVIDANYFRHDPRRARLSLTPGAEANPMAVEAIRQADLVVIAPGDLYTSLGPLLVIDGIGDALRQSNGLKIYVSNLVTKGGQTAGFTVSDHAGEIERFAGGSFLDFVIYNQQEPSAKLAARYREEAAYLTEVDTGNLSQAGYQAVGGNFLSRIAVADKADLLPATRCLIRHDATAVATAIMETYRRNRG
ncbi:MAG: gluconeogenesis factor YvcK family protein [Candidatus Saccharibacteria bacterium]